MLEIGCGWGGFVKFVNDNIGAKITGITISKKQFNYAKQNNCYKIILDTNNKLVNYYSNYGFINKGIYMGYSF